MIPELFAAGHRQTANSIYTVVGFAGQGLALALCGSIVTLAGAALVEFPETLGELSAWRLSLFLVAAPAPLFVALVASIRAPPRAGRRLDGLPAARAEGRASGAVAAAPGQGAPGQGALGVGTPGLAAFFRRHAPTLLSLGLGVGFASFAIASVAVWVPIAAIRVFGATQAEVGAKAGAAALVAAAIGWLATVFGTRLVRHRLGSRLPVLVIAFACAGAGAALLPMLGTGGASALFALLAVHLSFGMSGNMLFPTAMQDATPDHLRAGIVGLLGIVVLPFGAAGPAVVGKVSDLLSFRPDGLILAIVGTSATALALATVTLLVCGRSFAATVAAARRAEREAMDIP